MTRKEIIKKLDLFNRWRRGDCPFEEPGCRPPMEPNELTELINTVIDILKEDIKKKNKRGV